MLVETDRLLRIAVSEHINAVVAEARDPDIPFSVRCHSLRPDRTALVSVRRRDWHACQRESRNTSISIERWIAAIAHAPTEVAEPYGAVGIDCDAVTGAENAAT